jgi:hypothetical protein
VNDSSLSCNKCSKLIKKGSTFYKVHIVIRSQWDEYIEESGSVEDIDREIESIIKDLEHIQSSLIESDVHQNFTFILCRKCKEIFSANPLNIPLDYEDIPDSVPPEF